MPSQQAKRTSAKPSPLAMSLTRRLLICITTNLNDASGPARPRLQSILAVQEDSAHLTSKVHSWRSHPASMRRCVGNWPILCCYRADSLNVSSACLSSAVQNNPCLCFLVPPLRSMRSMRLNPIPCFPSLPWSKTLALRSLRYLPFKPHTCNPRHPRFIVFPPGPTRPLIT